ncbi:TIGR03084 family metal-binding protein [Streptomyces sp. NPDC092296]|uniref:TIGR03084 family metal-binding protein n=1 Tax=Streptomyces sp. NPDC092296 TaxID=3366012 RepID=UPI0038025F70
MTAMQDVFTDLALEGDELDAVVAALAPEDWDRATPAPGWTVKHQVAHLAFLTHLIRLSVSDADRFEAVTAPARGDYEGAMHVKVAEYVTEPVPELLRRWRDERAAVALALTEMPRGALVPWLAGPLPASVLAAAGLMELFAHGQDILDTLGLRRTFTDRIGHVAFLVSRTRDIGYRVRGLEPPAGEFRFELTAPSGTRWAFGPQDAEQRISGPAADLCLLATRRRHRDDLAVTATGSEADRWLDIAQAYRGSAGEGRKPAQVASA